MKDKTLDRLNKAIAEGVQADLDAQNELLRPLPSLKLEKVNPLVLEPAKGETSEKYYTQPPSSLFTLSELENFHSLSISEYKTKELTSEIRISDEYAEKLAALSDDELKNAFRVIGGQMMQPIYEKHPKFESLAQLAGPLFATFECRDEAERYLTRTPFGYLLCIRSNFCVIG